MRSLLLILLAIMVRISTFGAGVYAGYARAWSVPQLKILAINMQRGGEIQTDRFGRLRRYPGKTEIAYPSQDEATAVLLVAGQFNAGNFRGQRYQSSDDRVINFSEGRCYRAASPLLGADGQMGESWTLLGIKLVRSGVYNNVILIPVAIGGSSVRRWAAGGDLNTMLTEVIRAVKGHYTISGVLWDQGAEDFALQTPEDRYRSDLKSLIDHVRAEKRDGAVLRHAVQQGGATAGPRIIPSPGHRRHSRTTRRFFDGPNTDRDVTQLDRYDGYHFSTQSARRS